MRISFSGGRTIRIMKEMLIEDGLPETKLLRVIGEILYGDRKLIGKENVGRF